MVDALFGLWARCLYRIQKTKATVCGDIPPAGCHKDTVLDTLKNGYGAQPIHQINIGRQTDLIFWSGIY